MSDLLFKEEILRLGNIYQAKPGEADDRMIIDRGLLGSYLQRGEKPSPED